MKFLTALALLTALLFAPLALAETASAQTSHSHYFHRPFARFHHMRLEFADFAHAPTNLHPTYFIRIPEEPLTFAR